MTTYTAKTVDLFWRESTLCDISATTEQEAIDEAFEFAETLGLVLSEIEGVDGTHISFGLPNDIPVREVEVIIKDEGRLCSPIRQGKYEGPYLINERLLN